MSNRQRALVYRVAKPDTTSLPPLPAAKEFYSYPTFPKLDLSLMKRPRPVGAVIVESIRFRGMHTFVIRITRSALFKWNVLSRSDRHRQYARRAKRKDAHFGRRVRAGICPDTCCWCCCKGAQVAKMIISPVNALFSVHLLPHSHSYVWCDLRSLMLLRFSGLSQQPQLPEIKVVSGATNLPVVSVNTTPEPPSLLHAASGLVSPNARAPQAKSFDTPKEWAAYLLRAVYGCWFQLQVACISSHINVEKVSHPLHFLYGWVLHVWQCVAYHRSRCLCQRSAQGILDVFVMLDRMITQGIAFPSSEGLGS